MQNWAGKYIISYGRNYLKAGSREDKSDIKIAHIISVDFKGRNFIRCKAHVIHINYNDEHDWLNAGLNSKGYGQVKLEAYISPSYDIHDDEEVKTIAKEEALKIINDAREIAFIITDEWDNYHIQLKYKDHFSEVTIVYGIGSFCVIAPIEKLDEEKSTIFDLEKIYVKTTGDIIFVN